MHLTGDKKSRQPLGNEGLSIYVFLCFSSSGSGSLFCFSPSLSTKVAVLGFGFSAPCPGKHAFHAILGPGEFYPLHVALRCLLFAFYWVFFCAF